MKKKYKSLISLLVLVSFALIAGGSTDSIDKFLIIAPFVVIGIILILIPVFAHSSKEEEEKNKIRLEKRKQKNIEKANSLRQKYGEFTKSINYCCGGYILVNEEKSTIVINEHLYNFKDIISFDVRDNSKVIYSPTTSVTKSNTGSMLGRALVGGVLTGGAGVIVGGVTGSKTTTTSGSESTTQHSYSINITVDSLSEPIERINLGEKENFTDEIAALLSIIIMRNNQ